MFRYPFQISLRGSSRVASPFASQVTWEFSYLKIYMDIYICACSIVGIINKYIAYCILSNSQIHICLNPRHEQ